MTTTEPDSSRDHNLFGRLMALACIVGSGLWLARFTGALQCPTAGGRCCLMRHLLGPRAAR